MPKDTPTPFGMKVEFAILLAIGGGGVIAALWFAAVAVFRWLRG
jgi:hypothetical protein